MAARGPARGRSKVGVVAFCWHCWHAPQADVWGGEHSGCCQVLRHPGRCRRAAAVESCLHMAGLLSSGRCSTDSACTTSGGRHKAEQMEPSDPLSVQHAAGQVQKACAAKLTEAAHTPRDPA